MEDKIEKKKEDKGKDPVGTFLKWYIGGCIFFIIAAIIYLRSVIL